MQYTNNNNSGFGHFEEMLRKHGVNIEPKYKVTINVTEEKMIPVNKKVGRMRSTTYNLTGNTTTKLRVNVVVEGPKGIEQALYSACFGNRYFYEFLNSGDIGIYNITKYDMDNGKLSIRAEKEVGERKIFIILDITPE